MVYGGHTVHSRAWPLEELHLSVPRGPNIGGGPTGGACGGVCDGGGGREGGDDGVE